MALLEIKNLSKTINHNLAVENISLIQPELQKLAIVGATGSGKTTLLKMIGGLVQPDSGEILLQGQRVLGPDYKLLHGHEKIAYVSQYFELRNNYKVFERLEMANKMEEYEAEHIYEVCKIQHLLGRRTDELSGGERQRIVLASLLTTKPSLLLLDEPFSNLDNIHKHIIKTVIHDIGEQLNTTCILVSHDATDVLSWADRIVVMHEGHIIQDDTTEKVYYYPFNEYTAALLGHYNMISEELAASLLSATGQKIIRPEQFIITNQETGSITGIIIGIQFYGNYKIAIVKTAFQTIQVQLQQNAFIGDIVYIQLKEKYI